MKNFLKKIDNQFIRLFLFVCMLFLMTYVTRKAFNYEPILAVIVLGINVAIVSNFPYCDYFKWNKEGED